MKRSAAFEAALPPSKKQKLDNAESDYPRIPIDGHNLLSILLHPLDTEAFIKEYWTKKCYHVSIDDGDRVRDLLNGPFPFHLKTLLQDTASESIHVWMKSKSNSNSNQNNLLSFTVDDCDSALSCYHCGGSLYFRSSQELADMFIPSLMRDLRVGIAANDSDKNLRGEIEVFVAHKRHLTDWHYDFQHNFTIQLFGHKRWYLLPIDANNSSFKNVLRGNTPHYGNSVDSDLSAKECQFKLHTAESQSFDGRQWKEFDGADYKDKRRIIDLRPGSVLYFPSGSWHKVETMSDHSLSINLSIVPLTFKELLGNALNHYMSTQREFRQPMLCNDMRQTHGILDGLCGKLQSFVCAMQKYPSFVVPHSFADRALSADNTVCVETVDCDAKSSELEISVDSDSCFVLNPLSILLRANDIKNGVEKVEEKDLGQQFCSFGDMEIEIKDIDEMEPDGDGGILCEYILHVNFGESDSFASVSRIILQCNNAMTVKVIDWICDLRKKKQGKMVKFTSKDIQDFIENDLLDDALFHILRVFTFFGWLSLECR